jgi:chemotaxis signal transduction protein
VPLARIAARIRDRVLIDDPGLVRLDTAGRTTAAVALTTIILLGLVERHSGAQVVVLVGAISSWICGITVNDVNAADQRLTTALIPIPAICGLGLATVAAGNTVREDGVFLIVLFVAIYVRRYGQRGATLGVAGTFAYFYGLFVGTEIGQLPALAGAILLGTGSTFVMRFVVIPKHPRGSLYWVVEAVRAQLRLVREDLQQPGSSLADRLSLAMLNIARVNETMLTVLEQTVVAAAFDDLLFRCEIAAENWIVASVGDSEDAHRAAAERAMVAALDEVHRVTASAMAVPEKPTPQRDAILKEAQQAGNIIAYGLRPTTRQAIQVTVAAALAIVIGEHISPQRWYWAVLTSFVVFLGTTSAGETLARASAAFLGTVVGVVAGTSVGVLLLHNVVLESCLLFLSMLFAAYFLRVGLGVAWFFVTLILAMLYELLGRYSEAVLLIRLLEVLTGVVSGGLAAFAIFPTSTRAVFHADVRAALQALRDGIDSIASDGPDDAQPSARRFDAAVRRLRLRVRPARSGPTFAGASLFARRWLRNIELCAYYARNAVCASREPPGAEPVRGTLEVIDRLLSALDGDPSWPRSTSPVPELVRPELVEGSAGAYVYRIIDTLKYIS